jgi:epoxyqueuosine reductase
MSDNISNRIKQKSRELGFMECGIVPAGFLSEEEEHLYTRIETGMHGTMEHLARNPEKRLNPALVVDNAKTVIVVLQNYFTSIRQTSPEAPVISRYAYGTDYHQVMQAKLQKLLQFIRTELPNCSGRVFVDSAPLLEKAWARRAGLGWIGKNSLLISPHHGTFFFIGEIILDAELQYDETLDSFDHCGSCTLCMEACPTQAIVSPRVIDARLCVAYQTIEHSEGPDENLRGTFRNRVFGCDICQEVCPWSNIAREHEEPYFLPSSALLNLTVDEWDLMDEALFNKLFHNSAVNRTGYQKLKRNIRFLRGYFCPGIKYI